MRISDWSSDVCSSDLPITADLVGVSLSTAAGKACYIPLGHTVGKPADGGLDLDGATEAPKQIPRDDALAILKPMLEDPGALKVGQNIKYDMLVFARYGIAIGRAACRERVCQYMLISGDAVLLKKKNNERHIE